MKKGDEVYLSVWKEKRIGWEFCNEKMEIHKCVIISETKTLYKLKNKQNKTFSVKKHDMNLKRGNGRIIEAHEIDMVKKQSELMKKKYNKKLQEHYIEVVKKGTEDIPKKELVKVMKILIEELVK